MVSFPLVAREGESGNDRDPQSAAGGRHTLLCRELALAGGECAAAGPRRQVAERLVDQVWAFERRRVAGGWRDVEADGVGEALVDALGVGDGRKAIKLAGDPDRWHVERVELCEELHPGHRDGAAGAGALAAVKRHAKNQLGVFVARVWSEGDVGD